MTNTLSACSRRTLLAGLTASPALIAVAAPLAAQTSATTTAATQAQAALKNAKATKLVLLGNWLQSACQAARIRPNIIFESAAPQTLVSLAALALAQVVRAQNALPG